MKNIISIVLVYICLCCCVCGDYSTATNTTTTSSFQKCDKPLINEHSGDGRCMMTGITKLPDLFKVLIRLACRYKNGEEHKIEEIHKEVFPKIKEVMRCFGCGVDTILGTGELVEKLSSQGADAIKAIGLFVNKLFDAVHLSKPVANFACTMTKFSASDCMASLLKDNIPALHINLKRLSCEAQKGRPDDQLILRMMGNVSCLADEALKTGKFLENTTQAAKGLLGELLRNIIKTILVNIDSTKEALICKEQG